jgi:argininosuccinate synthase
MPVIAEKLVEIARIEQAPAVAHADARGQAAPIDRILRAMGRKLEVEAPAGEWAMTREQQVDYAAHRGVTLPADMIGGVAVRTAGPPPQEPAFVDVAFQRGVPVGINGVVMPLGDLIASLDILALAHGVGLAALGLLHVAHGALRRATLAPAAEEFSEQVADQYVRVLEEGAWFTPLRHALDAYLDSIQPDVAGTARLRLFQGECTVDGTRRAMKRTTLTMAKNG